MTVIASKFGLGFRVLGSLGCSRGLGFRDVMMLRNKNHDDEKERNTDPTSN